MRVLVCGGRDYWDREHVYAVLDELDRRDYVGLNGLARGGLVIITGGCDGADTLALQWAILRGVAYDLYEVSKDEWIRFGKAAGPRRNTRMIVEGKPELVLAFSGHRGTKDMVTQARMAKIEVRHV